MPAGGHIEHGVALGVRMTDPNETSRQEPFLRLFLRHQLQIEACVRTLVPHQADADELLQDVAAVLWRKFDDFQPGTRFDHWACRVAHNHVLNYFRSKRQEKLVFSETLLASLAEEVVRQNDLWMDRRDALENCLSRLPSTDRQLIRRRFLGCSTNRAVAQQTGRSESSVSRALNRIYSTLLKCIHRQLDSTVEGGAP